jgi:hypothetical protein
LETSVELAAQAEPAAKTRFNDFFKLCLAEVSKAAALAVVEEDAAAEADAPAVALKGRAEFSVNRKAF